MTGWLSGGPEAAGFMTTGGTESILLAVEAARQRGLVERDVRRPNVVLPTSAHAAFEKGAHYFGLENRRIPVRDDWRADVDAMAAAIDDETVLVVGSAPQYPQGVIDPVAEIAALADERDINCHVDACMGGVTLPYLARLGYDVPPFDFSRPRRHVDLGRPAQVRVHGARARRSSSTARGRCAATRCSSPRTGSAAPTARRASSARSPAGRWRRRGPCSTTWATTATCGWRRPPAPPPRSWPAASATTRRWSCRAEPDAMLLAFGAADPDHLDVFALADALWRRGWYVDRQGPPPSLHCTVNAIHAGRIPEFLADLDAAVAEVADGRDPRRAGRLRHRGVMPSQGRRVPDR